MSHVPTVLKSDRSVFDKMLPVDDNDLSRLILHSLVSERFGLGVGCLIWSKVVVIYGMK